VVNRLAHLRHSRRRRIDRPPSQVRESITFKLSLSASQYGQRIGRASYPGQEKAQNAGEGDGRVGRMGFEE
jgi:hypothetical protein